MIDSKKPRSNGQLNLDIVTGYFLLLRGFLATFLASALRLFAMFFTRSDFVCFGIVITPVN